MGINKLSGIDSKVHIVKKIEKTEKYFAPGILIFVENGAGDLYEAFVHESGNGYCNLQLKGTPLFQIQGDEYYCPTCEKIVRTAYQLEQTEDFRLDKINTEEIGLEEIVSEITPLLKLLESGFYCLWDTKLYPTDGNGNLFWDYPNNNNAMPGSCVLYFGDGEWGTCVPHFMIATQPKKLLNMERVNYYRTKSKCKAIAYYMDGNITALIDGHHKAMAAAIDHRLCNSIVISKCFCGSRKDSKGEMQKYIGERDIYIFYDELPDQFREEKFQVQNRPKEIESTDSFKINTNDCFPCYIDTKSLADFYPSVKEAVSADIFGPITDEFINDYLNGKINIGETDFGIFLDALSATKNERLFKVIDYTLYHNDMADYILPSLEHLFGFPHTEELENYLISYMIEIEGEHREIGTYIAQNLW